MGAKQNNPITACFYMYRAMLFSEEKHIDRIAQQNNAYICPLKRKKNALECHDWF